MSFTADWLNSIRASETGATLAELLAARRDVARSTAQRVIAKLIDDGQVTAPGEGLAHRYLCSLEGG